MTVDVLGVECVVLEMSVPAHIAHPDGSVQGVCQHCAVVAHPSTKEPVLVWGFRTGDFTISRHDPNFEMVKESWPL